MNTATTDTTFRFAALAAGVVGTVSSRGLVVLAGSTPAPAMRH